MVKFVRTNQGSDRSPQGIQRLTGDVFSRIMAFLPEKEMACFAQASTYCYGLSREGSTHIEKNLAWRGLRRGVIQNLMELLGQVSNILQDSKTCHCVGNWTDFSRALCDIDPTLGKRFSELKARDVLTKIERDTLTKSFFKLQELRGTDHLHSFIAKRGVDQIQNLLKSRLDCQLLFPLGTEYMSNGLRKAKNDPNFELPPDIFEPESFWGFSYLHFIHTQVYRKPSTPHPVEELEIYRLLCDLINEKLTSQCLDAFNRRLEEG